MNLIKRKIFEQYVNGRLPSFIIFIIFPNYYRPELKKSIYGILQYNNPDSKSVVYRIRRNIHRIEKGINSKNRKPFFGKDYIYSTFMEYRKNKDFFSETEKSYIENVLSTYCRLCSFPKEFTYIKSSIENHLNCEETLIKSSAKWINLSNQSFKKPFFELIKARRSARFFKQEKLDEKMLQEIFETAFNIPSACNRLPFRVIRINNIDKRANVLKYADGLQGDVSHIPYCFVVVGDYSAYISHADRHLIYIDSSYYIFLWQLIAFSQGIGSCILNYSENEIYDKDLELLLDLKPWEKLINFVVFGKVDHDEVPISQKEIKYSSIN